MLELQNISKSFGEKVIFKDFSYNFKQNGVVFIKGASGCGKTTLLRIIAGLEKIDGGSVIKEGSVSYLFQEDRLLPWLSASENIACVLSGKGKDKKKKSYDLLKTVGLEGSENADIRTLSGGMKRRVALCRALSVNPDILLLDEPMSALDKQTREVLLKVISDYAQNHLVIFVTHQDDDINRVSGEVLEINP